MNTKTGILLINLGTPDNPDKASVRRYLKEFLSDPRVIDIPRVLRWILLYGFILPFRPKQSAAAYQQIWQPEGSPLLIHSTDLKDKLQQRLGDSYEVALGMRYGEPSIAEAIKQLNYCEKIHILPLFPQYASASTGSALEKALGIIATQQTIPALQVTQDFFDQDFFIDSYSSVIAQSLQTFAYDFVLFSYHGLPEKQIRKAGCPPQHCDMKQHCPSISSTNRFCYRAQCYATTRALAKKLHLNSEQFSTSFQSRLGRTPWIQPYTDEVLPSLAHKGIKHLAIACPAFTADCLETIEEIGMQAQEQWHTLGGSTLKLVPCLNADELWVDALANYLR